MRPLCQTPAIGPSEDKPLCYKLGEQRAYRSVNPAVTSSAISDLIQTDYRYSASRGSRHGGLAVHHYPRLSGSDDISSVEVVAKWTGSGAKLR